MGFMLSIHGGVMPAATAGRGCKSLHRIDLYEAQMSVKNSFLDVQYIVHRWLMRFC